MHAREDGEQPGEHVVGTTRTLREVEALPDGRRVTWYRTAPAPSSPPVGEDG